MIYKMYTIFDRCTAMYGDPFTAVNDDDCKRKIAYSFRENPYKADLVLYCLGSFEPNVGMLTPLVKPEMVCNVLECYEVADNE